MMKEFLLAFVPIFVAVDAFGLLPIFLNLTDGLAGAARKKIVLQSFLTAVGVAVTFVFLGKAVFRLMGITVHDFMVAGGVLLFAISAVDLIRERKFTRHIDTVGAVPLGTPLIVGPAVLTTSLMLVDVYGLAATLLSLVVNIVLACVVLSGAGAIEKVLGHAGSKAVSKVASLILAAIAVMMIRKGLMGIIAGSATN
jgi:multiple antibiotic resistance protein